MDDEEEEADQMLLERRIIGDNSSGQIFQSMMGAISGSEDTASR